MSTALTAPTLEDWQGTIDGLVIGDGTDYDLKEITGWEDLPDVYADAAKQPNADGNFPGDEYAGARFLTYTIEVAHASPSTFAALVDALRSRTPNARDASGMDLWFKFPQMQAVHVSAKVQKRALPTDLMFERGLGTFRLEFKADDPVIRTASGVQQVSFPAPNGGLEFPLFADGVLDFGTAGEDGTFTITNQGNTPIAPRFLVAGPVAAAGFEILELGGDGHLQFEAAVASGAQLTLDASDATVLLDGVSNRSKYLTKRQWPVVAAESTSTFKFLPLGSVSAATLTTTYESGWI